MLQVRLLGAVAAERHGEQVSLPPPRAGCRLSLPCARAISESLRRLTTLAEAAS